MRRRPLVGWLAAEAVSLTGTRVSMVAIPWFVLTTTGSATQTGLVAFAEMGPYVVAKALAGPVVDRVGARPVSIAADTASVAAVGAIPLLHTAGALAFPLLLALVALTGALRGPGDGAKQALVPAVVEASGVAMERATGLGSAVERLASTVGAALAGLLVAAVGPVPALFVDAGSFAVSAVLIAATAPRQIRTAVPAEATSYPTQLREGWDFLRRDPVLVGIVVMVAITNLLDAAYAGVLVPVWAARSGGGAAAIGLLFAVFSGAAFIGSGLAATIAERLPRYPTYVGCFLLAGLPRFVVLALDAPLVGVLVVAAVGGFAAGFINPVLGAVIYERIPAHLMGRVTSLNTSLCWAGIPFGGIVGGVLVATVGLSPALLVAGVAYLAATLLPAVQPQWRQMDSRSAEPVAPTSSAAG